MTRQRTRKILLHVAINERGDYRLSQTDPQQVLTELSQSVGGEAFRVIDVELEIPVASVEETRRRRAAELNLHVVE